MFVDTDSIVRKIWGRSDTVLFIFAGAAAEFAVNKAVDWLYFTGRLPADPLGRLFSTVSYSRQILFSKYDDALKAIDGITAIHKGVEKSRGTSIPDWAYLDVLFLLIDYSIRSFEALERKLSYAEKKEIFSVFQRVGERMNLNGLPVDYEDYLIMRGRNLQQNLVSSNFTADLYVQYKKHLGYIRFLILKQVQLLLAPADVKKLLPLGRICWIRPVLAAYKMLRALKAESFFKNALLPNAYKLQIQSIDHEG
ncbi:MAG TPA: oxygenase MpaB family protein [Mucilaginibacter sp.]